MECEYAARKLGLSDITVEDDRQDGVSWNPPFCYMQHSRLLFNHWGTNTGPCSSNYQDKCLCKKTDMDRDMECPGMFDPNERLVRAAALGNIKMTKSLLMCNETVINHADRDGRTSLYIASHHGRAEMVSLLLSQPLINVNQGRLSNSGPADENETPLFIASYENKPGVVRDNYYETSLRKLIN